MDLSIGGASDFSRLTTADPVELAAELRVTFDEAEIGHKTPYSFEIENTDTCQRLEVAVPELNTGAESFSFLPTYDGGGAMKDDPRLAVGSRINREILSVDVTGDTAAISESGPVDRYTVRLLEDDAVVAASDPRPVAIGYPGEPSLEPLDDGGAEIRWNKHPDVKDDWTVEWHVVGDGEIGDTATSAGEHDDEFVLDIGSLPYDEVKGITVELYQDRHRILEFERRFTE